MRGIGAHSERRDNRTKRGPRCAPRQGGQEWLWTAVPAAPATRRQLAHPSIFGLARLCVYLEDSLRRNEEIAERRLRLARHVRRRAAVGVLA